MGNRFKTTLLVASMALVAAVPAFAQDLPMPRARTETPTQPPTGTAPTPPLPHERPQDRTPPKPPSPSSRPSDSSDQSCKEPPRKLGQYVVQFDQRNARFLYPDHAPFDDDEIVLQICNTTPWNRYRLIFGSKTPATSSSVAGKPETPAAEVAVRTAQRRVSEQLLLPTLTRIPAPELLPTAQPPRTCQAISASAPGSSLPPATLEATCRSSDAGQDDWQAREGNVIVLCHCRQR